MKEANGYSLIEILVVITIFAVLAVMITQIIIASLRGSKQSGENSKARASVNYAIGIMERQLREAQMINCPTSSRVEYLDQSNFSTYFSKSGDAIASGSAEVLLTESDVPISVLSFTCDSDNKAVTIKVETDRVSVQTKIYLRNN